jgi:hypothetical protein
MPSNVSAWYYALASAVTKGELNFEPKFTGYGNRATERDVQKRNPQLDTIVTLIPAGLALPHAVDQRPENINFAPGSS